VVLCCNASGSQSFTRKVTVVVIEVRNAELIETVAKEAERQGITQGAIVSLIGAVDRFAISTMPANDARQDTITEYTMPAEMSGTGEIVDGKVHIHAVMAVEGDRGIAGHLHRADVGVWFARAYVLV
jgi:uncharacterized protein